MRTTAVIMAGGKGKRFWPKSRNHLPKQFLSLTEDGKTMIQLTAARLLSLVSYDDMFIVTNSDYAGLVKNQLSEIPYENILAEPRACNTAPCIAFAAAMISRKYEDAIMMILPSDHLIRCEEMYIDTIKRTTDECGNIVSEDVITIDTKNSIIMGEKKLIATVGLEDLIIVDTDDTILLCAKNAAHDIRKVIENLKNCNRNELI